MRHIHSTPCPRCGSATATLTGVCPRCAARLALSEPADAGLDLGDYQLGEEIGRGAMGAVYRARHTRLGREVALKVILAGSFAAAAERRRFLVEAESAARLDHPNLVALYEHGEADGRLFHAMQLIEGRPLAERLREGPLPAREAAALLEKCARAVHHAHERGVLHRDLKPANILLDAAGEPHVADFGLARQTGIESSLTVAGSPIGTPSYMAPELAAGGEATARADVWSLGVLLYEMLTGRPPFDGASLPEVLLAVHQTEPASLRAFADRDMETVCLRCLEKEPARRYSTALALADDLARWLRGEPVEARPITGAERIVKWMRRRPAISALAALALVSLFGGVAGVVWQWRRADREAASARAALDHANESLWRANLDRAHALRVSRLPGQRIAALDAIRDAAAFRPTRELRDEAVAAMALPDIGAEIAAWTPAENARVLRADAAGENVAVEDAGLLKFVSLKTGNTWAQTPAGNRAMESVDCSPDLRIAVVARGRRCTLTEVAGGQTLIEREGFVKGRLSADGRTLFLSADTGAIESVDVQSGRTLAQATLPADGGWSVAPEEGGGRLALWSSRTVAVLKANDLSRLAELSMPAGVMRAEWTPDGALLIGVDDQTLVHWDPASGVRSIVARHEREGVTLRAHPKGLLVASMAWDSMAKITAPGWGELLRAPGVRVCGFSSDGRRIVHVQGRTAVAAEFVPPDVWLPLPLRPTNYRRIVFSPDGGRVATLHEREVALWDAASQRLLAAAPLASPQEAVWESRDSLLVGSNAALDRVRFEEKDGGVLAVESVRLMQSTARGSSVALLPRGRVAYTGAAGIFTPAAPHEIEPIQPNPWSNSLAASPDGKWLAAGCWANNGMPDSYVPVWQPGNPVPVVKLPSGNSEVAFSPDGKRLLVAETSRTTEYESGTWRKTREWPRSSAGFDAVRPAFSPDGRLMVLSTDEFTLLVLDAVTGGELVRLASPVQRKVVQATFSSDGRWLGVVSTGLAQLWDIALMRENLRALGLDWEQK